MFVLLARRTRNREAWALGRFTVRVAVASALSGAACYRLANWIELRMDWKSIKGAMLLLTAVGLFGLALYVLLAAALRVREVEDYLQELCSWFRPAREAGALRKQTSIVWERE